MTSTSKIVLTPSRTSTPARVRIASPKFPGPQRSTPVEFPARRNAPAAGQQETSGPAAAPGPSRSGAASGARPADSARSAAALEGDAFRDKELINPFAAPRKAPDDVPDPPFMLRNRRDVQQRKQGLRRVEGELFVNGPSLEDPRKGMMGDCYLLASLAALAQVAPHRVRERMRTNPDGTVTVTFHTYEDAKRKPTEVTVDADLLVHTPAGATGPMVHASSAEASGLPEMWVPLLEKAYAQLKGGYEKIGHGGHLGWTLETLTGQDWQEQLVGKFRSRYDRNSEGAKDRVWNFLQESVQLKDAVVAATPGEARLLDHGLLPGHAYTFVGIEEKNGRRFVTLRNSAPDFRELLRDPQVRQGLLEDPGFRPMATMLLEKGEALRLHQGTFTIPLSELERTFYSVYRSAPGN